MRDTDGLIDFFLLNLFNPPYPESTLWYNSHYLYLKLLRTVKLLKETVSKKFKNTPQKTEGEM